MPPVSRPTVSVVVAAYDEEEHLPKLLDSMSRQTYPPLDVVVADDGSRDHTARIAEEAGATVLRLDHRGPAVARNEAARAARGEILVFLDADMFAAPDFIERVIAPIAEGREVGTFTKEIFLANAADHWAAAYAAIRWSPPDRLIPVDFPDRWENFRAIRRDAFLSVGGYDDVGYGEDLTVAVKLGADAGAVPGAVCFHHHPASVREIFDNGRWVGRGTAIRSLRNPWWDHSLPRVMLIGFRQVLQGRTPWVVPARLVYHLGVLLGLAETTFAPERHWK